MGLEGTQEESPSLRQQADEQGSDDISTNLLEAQLRRNDILDDVERLLWDAEDDLSDSETAGPVGCTANRACREDWSSNVPGDADDCSEEVIEIAGAPSCADFVKMMRCRSEEPERDAVSDAPALCEMD